MTPRIPRSGSAVARAGRALAGRQVVGLVLGLVTVVVVTRFVGPGEYGVYAAAFAVTFTAQTWGELSLDIRLVRHEGELPPRVFDQVFTLLCLSSVITPLVVVALAVALPQQLGATGRLAVAVAMALTIPLTHLQQVPLARLERALDYGRVGAVEVAAQVALAAVSIGWAVLAPSAWAPVAGYVAQQVLLLVGYWAAARVRPRLVWDRSEVAALLGYGFSATSATAVYGTRSLVAPVVLGAALGPVAVGYAALAVRLVEQAAFLRSVVVRMSYALIGRLGGDSALTTVTVERLMLVQVAVAGLPVVGLSLMAPLAVPMVFGPEWAEVAGLVPLLVPGLVITALFTPHVAVLLGRRPPWEVFVSNGVNAVLLWVAAVPLVAWAGVRGYAYADIASTASWVLLAVLFRRRHRAPRYLAPLSVAAAVICLALSPLLSPWWALAGGLLLVNPLLWRRYLAIRGPLRPRPGRHLAGVPSNGG